jgi:hypothetical protein
MFLHSQLAKPLLQRVVKPRNLPFSFKPEQCSRLGLLPQGVADDYGKAAPFHLLLHTNQPSFRLQHC